MPHPFADHFRFQLADLTFGDSLPVVMTEKDAVKVKQLNPALVHDNFWYLEVDVSMPPGFLAKIIKRLGVIARHKITTDQHLQ